MTALKRSRRAGANKMAVSLKRGERVALEQIDVFADGVAIKRAGNSLACMHARLRLSPASPAERSACPRAG